MFHWPLACRRVNKVLLLLLYLSLLSWFLALDNGCSAMNSSLKATVLEYIYKWTEKGWYIQQVSELYSSPKRQTQDKLCKDICSSKNRKYHTWYTYMTDICRAVGFLIKIIYSLLLIPHDYSGEKQLKINADNSFFDVFSCYFW